MWDNFPTLIFQIRNAMKSLILYLILPAILFANTKAQGQEGRSHEINDQVTNKAQSYVTKILSFTATAKFHAIYYNADESPEIYVFTCSFIKNAVEKTLTIYLSADSSHSLTTFYYDRPIDEKIIIPYEKLIVCNQGIVLKIRDNVFKRYPDYTPVPKEELIFPDSKLPSPKFPAFPKNSVSESLPEPSAELKSTNADAEVIIADVPNYLWYLNCGFTTDLMYIGYWNDQGYPSLIPGGNNETGFYWAVAEESCFWGEAPDGGNPGGSYYAQAAEYGNDMTSEIIWPTINTWDSYQELIDTHNRPVYVGWQGTPYGAHATLGIGYKLIDGKRFFILHDTWYDTPSYVSYDDYSTSVSGYYYWHPTSEAQNLTQQHQATDASGNEITLNVKNLDFSPALTAEEYPYHHFEFADLNNDDKEDIIVCNFRNLAGTRLLLYFNNGTNYTLKEDFNPVFEWYECLHVAKTFDYENDGDLDILVTGYWSIVRIYINENGTINPEPIVIDNTGRGFIDCDFGDFDKDGDFDILASTVSGYVRMYKNNDGDFTSISEFNMGSQSFKVRFSDINNDGFPEIIASKRNGTVVIFENDNGIMNTDEPLFSPSGHGGMSFDVGDVDNDGWKDIVTVKDGTLLLYRNINGTFSDNPQPIVSPPTYPKSITLTNLDDDNSLELIVGNFNRPNFILQNTNGSFESEAAWLAAGIDPTFSITTYLNEETNKILIAFGKSRGGNIEFLETNSILKLEFTINAIPGDGGSVTGAGDYGNGQICNLTAIPAIGYDFVNWTEAGIEVSTQMEFSFVVEGNRDFVANFEKVTDNADMNAKAGFKVYPNPASGKVYVSGEKNAELKVLRITGQTIQREIMNDDEIFLDLSKQERGIYIIEYITNDTKIVKKIVLK